MIFQRDLVSLRQLAIDIKGRLDIHIGEATDLVHIFMNMAHDVVSFFTVGHSLPELMTEKQVLDAGLGFANSYWWVRDMEQDEHADGVGIRLDDAVYLLGYGEETADKILASTQLLLGFKELEIPTDIPTDTLFFKLPSKAPKKMSTEPTVEGEKNGWDGFDEKAPNYPLELDVALQAWTAVSNDPSVGRVRERLERWVRMAYPQLLEAAVQRIVGVCNWDKSGGRPKAGE